MSLANKNDRGIYQHKKISESSFSFGKVLFPEWDKAIYITNFICVEEINSPSENDNHYRFSYIISRGIWEILDIGNRKLEDVDIIFKFLFPAEDRGYWEFAEKK